MTLNYLATKLAKAQIAHPYKFLLFAVIITVISGFIVSGLYFDSSYEALLPKDAPEVKNADIIRDKTGGTRQLVIAIKGKTEKTRVEFGKKLIPLLQDIKGINFVDLEFPTKFFKDRGLWLTDIKTLDELIPTLNDAVNIAKIQANPLALHLDEDAEKLELENAWKKVDDIINKKRENQPFNKILNSKDNKYTFLMVVPSIKFSDMKAGRELLESIQKKVNSANPKDAQVQIKYAGALAVLQEQHIVMGKDLRNGSIAAMIFGVLIVAFFTRRLTAPFVIGVALFCGIVWTFAMAQILIGHINIITGFLAAVLIGLGIDFGIHLYIRYQQEVRVANTTIEEALVKFVAGTAAPALTAALTTAGVFFSFVFADFRGFSEFGLIAGTGVILTFISSFLILPPLLLIVFKKFKSTLKPAKKTNSTLKKVLIPTPLALVIVIIMLSIAGYGAFNAQKIPFRNNFKQLRGTSDATDFFEYVDNNLGAGFNPAVFLTTSVDDAKKLKQIAHDTKNNINPSGEKSRIGKIISVSDLLPQDIEQHQIRIDKLYKILWDPKLDKAASQTGHRAQNLVEARKMVKTKPWVANEIPDVFKRRFLTQKGDEFIVYMWPSSRNDADYQAASWEIELDDLSSILNKQNIKHQKADETLIVAWIYRLIHADGPPLLILAAIVVFVFLLIDFRNPKKVLLVLLPLTVGMFIFFGLAHLLKMELNMFNMVVVPSIIGIGIDNAVHIFHRYQDEGKGSVVFVIKNTGVAALLASTTTAVGFGSSMISHNIGLQTMGSLAVVGIFSTFLAAVVFFPSFLTLLELTKKVKAKK